MTPDGASKIFHAAFDAGSALVQLLDLVNEHGEDRLRAVALDRISRALAEVGSVDNKVRLLFPELHAEVEAAVTGRGSPCG